MSQRGEVIALPPIEVALDESRRKSDRSDGSRGTLDADGPVHDAALDRQFVPGKYDEDRVDSRLWPSRDTTACRLTRGRR